ncbi:MAG: flagellar motor switch protein FliN [Calditrichaeota bacterium]|nr:flagellar motor switch protein FliN [Calditrichota bacterium]
MTSTEMDNGLEQSELFEPLGAWFEGRRSELELALTTLTERKVILEIEAPRLYSMKEVFEQLAADPVLVTSRFSNKEIGGWLFLFSRELAAMLSDLAMMGEGNVPFDESLHPGTLAEVWGQITATCETEVAALSGDELTVDMPESSLDMQPGVDLLEIAPVIHLKVNIEGVGEGIILMIFEPSFVSLFGSKPESVEEISDDDSAVNVDRQTGMSATPDTEMSASSDQILSDMESAQRQPVARSAEFEDFGELPVQQTNNQPGKPRNIDMLLDVNLPITIELGRTKMLIRDVLDLGQGSIIELEKLSGEPVDLFVNNKKFARGEVVVIEENFGVRITELITIDERLKALN